MIQQKFCIVQRKKQVKQDKKQLKKCFQNNKKETLSLSWLKNRWILTDIDVKPEPLSFDTNEFKSEYWTTLKACNDDVVTACQQLRFRYPWIPSRTVMENEEKELKELF